MKKFLKVISLVLALASLVTIMSGCQKKEDDNGVPTLVWYMQKPVSDMSRQEMVEEAANAIIEPAIGAKIKFQFVDAGAWPQKKNVLISSGEEFDLMFESGTTFVNNAEKGAFLDLRPYMTEELMPEILSRTEQFGWDAVTFRDGGVYAVPAETFYVPYTSVAFKKDIVEKYNFDYMSVKTYDDMLPLFEAVKKNEPGMYGFIRMSEFHSMRYVPTTEKTVYFDTETETFIPYYESPAKQEFWQFIKKCYDLGYIPADAASKTETNAEIKSGKYAMFYGQMSADKSTSRHGFDCVENAPQYYTINRTNVTNALTCVSRTTKHPEKVVQLLNLIWEDRELSNLLCFGIEGLDYVVTKNPGTDERFVDANNGNDVKWAIWHNWIGPLWDQWDSDWNSTESLVLRQNLNKQAEVSPIIGFLPDLSEFKTELAMIGSINEETAIILETGSMPNYDEYMASLKKRYAEAGLNDIVDAMNKQYKEWKNK